MPEAGKPPFRYEFDEPEYGADNRYSSFSEKPEWMIKPIFDRSSQRKPLVDPDFIDKFQSDSQDSIEWSSEKLAEYKALFTKLDDFNIYAPQLEFVIGHDIDGSKNAYLARKKIDGIELGIPSMAFINRGRRTDSLDRVISPDFFSQMSVEQSLKLKDLLINLFNYYRTKISSKKVALADLTRPEQYVFGRPSDEPNTESSFYLVDLDPLTEDYSRIWDTDTCPLYCLYHFMQSYLKMASQEDAIEILTQYLELTKVAHQSKKELEGNSYPLRGHKYELDPDHITDLIQRYSEPDQKKNRIPQKINFRYLLQEIESLDFSVPECLTSELETLASDAWFLIKRSGVIDKALRYRIELYLSCFDIRETESEESIPSSEMIFQQKSNQKLRAKVITSIAELGTSLKDEIINYLVSQQ